MQALVDVGFDALQAFARGREPLVDNRGFYLNELDAGVVGAFGASELFQIVGIARMRANVVDHQDGLGAVIFRIRRLGEDLRVGGIDLAFEDAFVVEFLRLVTQENDDFAFDVETRVIVVIVFGSGNAEAGEYARYPIRCPYRRD